MNRRQFLLSSVAATTPLLAGCGGTSDEPSIRDSDGDGVIDSEDYAPRDPDVQDISDVRSATPVAGSTRTPTATDTATPITTSTETPEPTAVPTDAPEPTSTASADTISVSGDSYEGTRTYISEYSLTEVTAQLTSFPEIPESEIKLLVATYYYPRDTGLGVSASDTVTVPSGTSLETVTIDHDPDTPAEGERVHHLLFAMPPELSASEATASDVTFLFETDPFVVEDGSVEPDTGPYELSDSSTESYARESLEGLYDISMNGTTDGQDWSFNFIVWKSAYAIAREEPRGRSYSEYVQLAQDDGIADSLASLLDESATDNGFTTQREKVDLVIDVVQNLPYTSDDVSTGYDQYTKTVQETITEAEGDCEDTAILLAAVLQAEPFGYDTVLIAPPGHMATGIYGEDTLQGTYWEYDGRRYYYIETTGSGWGIGDLPATYEGDTATVYQV